MYHLDPKTGDLTEQALHKLKLDITTYIFYSLIDRATKKMRGISLHYENSTLHIQMYFDEQLIEEEEEEMECVHTEIISNLPYDFFKSFGIDMSFFVIANNIELYSQKGNLGWIFLRKEYQL